MTRTPEASGSRYVGFDIETTGLVEPGAAPPEVLCAVTIAMTQVGPGRYRPEPAKWWPWTQGVDCTGPRVMSYAEICALVDYLWAELHRFGAPGRVLAWNGVGYDLRVLWLHCRRAEDAATAERVRELAVASCDPMLSFCFRRGFPVKLAAVAAQLPVPMAKTGNGADCAEQWLEGDSAARRGVLEYCTHDVVLTCTVLAFVEQRGEIAWRTKRGSVARWRPPAGSGEVTAICAEVRTWEFPDNSWMAPDGGDRPSPAEFVEWLQ